MITLVIVGVASGLVTSFAAFTLLGGVILSSLGLPADALRWVGIVTLGIVGLGLAVPAVGHILERPFQNTRIPTLSRDGNGFVMGLALGLVFVPCAGPTFMRDKSGDIMAPSAADCSRIAAFSVTVEPHGGSACTDRQSDRLNRPLGAS